MATYIKVNNTEYPAEINGNPKDRSWGDRDTKTITLTMTAAEVAALLPDNTPWRPRRSSTSGTTARTA